jgi:hypothetical protein
VAVLKLAITPSTPKVLLSVVTLYTSDRFRKAPDEEVGVGLISGR